MYQQMGKLRRLPAVLAAAAVMATSIIVAVPSVALAAGTCTINEQGSTTVYPALIAAQSAFQGLSNCTLNIVANGSGTGITALLNYVNGVSGAPEVNIAASSRPLKSAEATSLYSFQIGGDAMVMAVRNSPAMSFLTHITMNQVQGIYNNTITTWDQIDPAYPNRTILARARIVGSGSRDDLQRLFGLPADSLPGFTYDAAVVARVGLPRLTTSNDESTAACGNDDQIVYTSLANLLTYGPAGQGCLKALSLASASTSNFVDPSVTSVQNGTYPAPRTLFLVVPKFSVLGGTATTDNTNNVKAFDLVNYFLTSAGQGYMAQVGFVNASIPAVQPIPDYDVNLDGAIGIGDIGKVIAKWTQPSNAVPGWIRADVNNDGSIGIGDIGKIIAKWSAPGFVPPAGQ